MNVMISALKSLFIIKFMNSHLGLGLEVRLTVGYSSVLMSVSLDAADKLVTHFSEMLRHLFHMFGFKLYRPNGKKHD